MTLTRYNADGSLDTGFGSSGKAALAAGSGDAHGNGVALQADGKVVVAGDAVGLGVDMAAARYAPGGSAVQRVYALQDANHNVTALADASGTVVQRFEYDPYGTSTVLNASWGGTADGYDWPVRFQGLRLDAATGLYDARNRAYSPALGRWLQPDPAGHVDGLNAYEYVRSGPLRYVDPAGSDAEPVLVKSVTYNQPEMRLDNGHKYSDIIAEVTLELKATLNGNLDDTCPEATYDLTLTYEWLAMTDGSQHNLGGVEGSTYHIRVDDTKFPFKHVDGKGGAIIGSKTTNVVKLGKMKAKKDEITRTAYVIDNGIPRWTIDVAAATDDKGEFKKDATKIVYTLTAPIDRKNQVRPYLKGSPAPEPGFDPPGKPDEELLKPIQGPTTVPSK